MRSIIGKVSFCLLVTFLAGCYKSESHPNAIKVGTIAGPETRLMEVARHVAKDKYNLDIQIVEFNDYTRPNAALADGSIDANMFQHQFYLDKEVATKGYQLVALGKTFVYPMGLYSQKYHALADLPQRAIIAIPNDPSNEARALLLLQKAGLIKLKSTTDASAAPADILDNPKQVKIIELDAAQLPRSLPDVDLAAINTNYALVADLIPSQDALFLEDKKSPYANIIAVRQAEQNNPKLKELVAAFQSDDVAYVARQIFFGQAIPAWDIIKK